MHASIRKRLAGQQIKTSSVGVSGQQWGVGYSLNYQYSRYTNQNNDRALSLNLSIPLERWLPRSRVSYQMTSLKIAQPNTHEMRLMAHYAG